MVSRYDAVKSISSRTVQELSMSISRGGIEHSLIKSIHGISQAVLALFNISFAVYSEISIERKSAR